MRKETPKLVVEFIAEFLTQGWNKKQAKSLAWAEFFEIKLAEYEAKSGGMYSPEIRIDCFCADCKDGGQLLPGTTIMWLGMHKGHNTRTIKIR